MEPPSGIHYPRPCGCKGIRRCLQCEGVIEPFDDNTACVEEEESLCSFVFCTHCSVAFRATVDDYDDKDCNWHRVLGAVPSMPFPGVTIFNEFITREDEKNLEMEIGAHPWAKSQSGRLKQDYGPKCNFKKRKLKLETFTGFPSYLEPIVAKFESHPLLADYHTVEQCNLDYDPARGSAIDPHFDDFWVWGERLLTLSLLSLTFLTMSLPAPDAGPKLGDGERAHIARRRREEAEERWRQLKNEGSARDKKDRPAERNSDNVENLSPPVNIPSLTVSNFTSSSIPATTPSSSLRVHLPMPPRSMMVLYGECRDTWVHEVRRCDIKERRIAIAFRELAEEFLPGGVSEQLGREVLEKAARFDGVSRIEC